jgi:hypothetical protein
MKVLIALLAHSGWTHNSTLKMLLQYADTPGIHGQWIVVEQRPVETARNYAFNYARVEGYDYLLFVDHDVACLRNPLELCHLDKDVLICPYPIVRGGKLQSCITGHTTQKGLEEIDDGGLGCALIARRVLTSLPAPQFLFEFHENGSVKTGEDVYFCRKARGAGFKVFCAWDYPCSHYKPVDLHALPHS